MPRRPTSVTHADLAPRRSRTGDLSSKTGALLTVLCILSGLFCFILCLIAEATRSEVTWMTSSDVGVEKGKAGNKYECVYSGSGKTPLLCASIAFVGLAIAMLVQHTFMLIAISKTAPPAFVSWETESAPLKTLTWQAAFFFVATWTCFAVGEIMLLIGLSVESGHLKNWSAPRQNCVIIKQGVFTAAGVFALITVFLAAGLYATALRVQWICQEQEAVSREVLEVSALYAASPAVNTEQRLSMTGTENSVVGSNGSMMPSLIQCPLAPSTKASSLV